VKRGADITRKGPIIALRRAMLQGHPNQDDTALTGRATQLMSKVISRELRYQKEDIVELDLAYAITIHKSQGSEYRAVIIPILSQHSRCSTKTSSTPA